MKVLETVRNETINHPPSTAEAAKQVPLLPVQPPETRAMVTSDGVHLDADIYRPAVGGPYPVLLMRQAYGRRIACTICYAHPSWYAAHGYVVVVQDIRGRGSSGGSFNVGENESADGAETVAWAAKLDGTTGDVGMYGFSYQGYTQLMAALAAGRALKALAPAMCPWDARRTWAYENGALRLQGALSWATQIAAETARHRGDEQAYADLLRASHALPLGDPIQARPTYMDRYRHLSHYHRWLDTPEDDPYWAAISPATHASQLAARNLPTLLIGGWYDTHLLSCLTAFDDLTRAGASRLRLAIGPWVHFPWIRRVGAIDFGPGAESKMDELHIRWFDRWLKGRDTGLLGEAPIQLFDLGTHEWRDFMTWPRKRLCFALSGSGKASIDPGDGRLDLGGRAALGIDYIVHDPWRPAPTVGGAWGNPAGPVDRSSIDARGDVLTFTTAPLDRQITLSGNVEANLQVICDAPSFDLCCVLARVTKTGQVFQVVDGYRTVSALPADGQVNVPMRASCVTLHPGEALRLSISLASFPAYTVNPGTGESASSTPSAKARIITLGVKYGDAAQSTLSVSTED